MTKGYTVLRYRGFSRSESDEAGQGIDSEGGLSATAACYTASAGVPLV